MSNFTPKEIHKASQYLQEKLDETRDMRQKRKEEREKPKSNFLQHLVSTLIKR